MSTYPVFVLVRRLGEGGHVAEVTLDRPAALNAISTAFAEQISAAMASLAADDDVRVVVISSTSRRAFCVGADLKERRDMNDAELMAHREISRQAYRSVLTLPMPAIAAIEGFALGGGLELALSCDIIVAGAGSTMALPEVSVGLIPGGGGTQLLTRRVGWSRAASTIFTARRLDAPAAHSLGIIDELVPTGSARDRALAFAELIGANSPIGVRNAKAAMRAGFDTDLTSGLEIEDTHWRATAISGDRREGIIAFNEKRRPSWRSSGDERD